MKLVLPHNIQNSIYEHVKKEYPKECCGVLIGKTKKQVLFCTESIKTNNIAANPYNFFEIDNQKIIDIQKKYREKNLTIIGHYHSHPNSALRSTPSETDIDSIFDKDLCWVIIGINGDFIELSAYLPIKSINDSYNLKKIDIEYNI